MRPDAASTLALVKPGKPGSPRYGRNVTLNDGSKHFLPSDERFSVVPQPQAVLTAAQVGEWLQMTRKAVLASNIPRLKLGHRTVRFHYAAVLAFIENGGRN